MMYVSMLLLALSGIPAADATEGSVWMTDYVQARKVAASEGKPLAVFVAPGKDAWSKLSNQGKLPTSTERVLTDSFVRCFVDSSTVQGKRLAQSLELNSGLGLVISDRTGDLMAFYHEGDLTDSLLTQYLQRYGDRNWVVRTTESNPGHGHGTACSGGVCTTGTCFGGSCSTGTCYGGSCSTGTCRTGTCYTGTCNSGGCYSGSCYGGCGGGRRGCRGGRCR